MFSLSCIVDQVNGHLLLRPSITVSILRLSFSTSLQVFLCELSKLKTSDNEPSAAD